MNCSERLPKTPPNTLLTMRRTEILDEILLMAIINLMDQNNTSGVRFYCQLYAICILRDLTSSFAEQNGRDAERAAAL